MLNCPCGMLTRQGQSGPSTHKDWTHQGSTIYLFFKLRKYFQVSLYNQICTGSGLRNEYCSNKRHQEGKRTANNRCWIIGQFSKLLWILYNSDMFSSIDLNYKMPLERELKFSIKPAYLSTCYDTVVYEPQVFCSFCTAMAHLKL